MMMNDDDDDDDDDDRQQRRPCLSFKQECRRCEKKLATLNVTSLPFTDVKALKPNWLGLVTSSLDLDLKVLASASTSRS